MHADNGLISVNGICWVNKKKKKNWVLESTLCDFVCFVYGNFGIKFRDNECYSKGLIIYIFIPIVLSHE